MSKAPGDAEDDHLDLSAIWTSISLSSRQGHSSILHSSPKSEIGTHQFLLSIRASRVLDSLSSHRKFFVVIPTGLASFFLSIISTSDFIPEGEEQDQQGGQAEKHGPGQGQ